jgi:predicted lipid-binding transport protein (Tim44 family)
MLSLLLAASIIGGSATVVVGEEVPPAAPPAAGAPAAGTPAPAAAGDATGAAAPAAPATDAPAAPAAAPAPAAAADTPAKGKNKGDKLTLDQLPDLVKACFTKEAPEATTIFKMAGKNGGEDTYRARYTDADGHKMQITVGTDGVLIMKGQAKGKN